jgi:hypothetical protein
MNIPNIIKDTVELLNGEMQRGHEDYRLLHEELDTHKGKPIDETNLEEVNRILKAIQDKFAQIYPAFSFITINNQYANNMINGYNEFIDQIKKGGGQEIGHQEPTEGLS